MFQEKKKNITIIFADVFIGRSYSLARKGWVILILKVRPGLPPLSEAVLFEAEQKEKERETEIKVSYKYVSFDQRTMQNFLHC